MPPAQPEPLDSRREPVVPPAVSAKTWHSLYAVTVIYGVASLVVLWLFTRAYRG